MKSKIPLLKAQFIAREIIEKISPACKQVTVAGSTRRMAQEVGDIEIVAEPAAYLTDLFGAPTENHSLDAFAWSEIGALSKDGHKYKKIIMPDGIGVDLFIVTEPAQWGVILALRTGSADFSRRLVTHIADGGALPAHLNVREGAIWMGKRRLTTPTEEDVFSLLGLRYLEPQKRH